MIELLGLILALAIALDSVAPASWKSQASSILSLSRATNQPKAANFVDRIFGPRILSIRALLVSFVLTIISATLMFAIAATSNVTILTELVRDLRAAGHFGFYALVIAVAFTVLADFFSYAKTRLFIRVIEIKRSAATTFAILLADFFASITIFCLIFAAGRMLIYILLGVFVAEPITQTFRIAPTVIARAAKDLKLDTVVKSESETRDSTRAMAIVLQSLQFSENESVAAEKISEWAAKIKVSDTDYKSNFVDFEHSVVCLEDNPEEVPMFGTLNAYTNSICIS